MQCGDLRRTLLTEEHHQLTLVFETLASLLLTVHEPSVIAVTQVHVTDVGSLRSVDLVAILHDHVWVSVADDTWIGETDRLVCALSVDVTDDDELSGRCSNVSVINRSSIHLDQHDV